MAEFSGSFQYLGPSGATVEQGDCRVQFDSQSLTLVPDSGAPTAMDLGDLDAVIAENFQIRLPIYTGRTLVLRQLGRAYERFAQDLLAAYRNRALQCMLLEDMQELARFPGAFETGSPAAKCPNCGRLTHGKFCPDCGKPVASSPGSAAASSGEAEIRLYQSNIAVLPSASQPFQVRLGDVDAVHFEPGAYEVAVETPDRSLKFKQLGKRTEEFARKVRDALSELGATTAQAIHLALPFLNPDELRQAASLLRDGRSASIAKLADINAKIPASLAANAVDADLKPYYDELLRRTLSGTLYAGFKRVRPEDGAPSEAAASPEDAGEPIADADAAAPNTLYWFFFPFATSPGGSEPANLVAWEAISRSGRATYFFRLADPPDAPHLNDPGRAAGIIASAVKRLNTALAVLNFRRRPVYLSDGELEQNPLFHRYAIAARRIPEVRQLRAAFVGRAMHSSLDAWQEQVAAILAKAAPGSGSA